MTYINDVCSIASSPRCYTISWSISILQHCISICHMHVIWRKVVVASAQHSFIKGVGLEVYAAYSTEVSALSLDTSCTAVSMQTSRSPAVQLQYSD